jgi:endonuclease YncB( thermonuclease family)
MIPRLAIALAGLLMASSADADVTGKPRVIAADTLEVGGIAVRLFGIVVPAPDQTCRWPDRTLPCGAVARTALMDLTAGLGEVACKERGRDQAGRILAVCFAEGFDLGRNMVHTGWAWADHQRAPEYAGTEAKAKAAKRGLWRGEFIPPAAARSKP